MKGFIAVCVICIQFCCSYGEPKNHGVGAYAYQDSAGNRYGGTYGLKDGQVFNYENDVTTFGPNPFTDFQAFPDIDSFFPDYFRNLEYCLQEAFAKSAENQNVALNAAKKAFDLTSNRDRYNPSNFGFDRFPGDSFGFPPSDFEMPGFDQNAFSGFNQNMPSFPDFQQNSAYAGGAVGPGYQRQRVNLNPPNSQMPNINVAQYSDPAQADAPRSGFYSVSSSSYAASSSQDGKEKNVRGGETVVNNNGKITKYSLHS